MKLLMIDNYDSFTFNLVQYFGELGADVQRAAQRRDRRRRHRRAARPTRWCSRPGRARRPRRASASGDPRRFAGKLPILGVCLGHQAIGAALGGKVVRAARLMHGKIDELTHDGRGVYAAPAAALHGDPLPLAGDRAGERCRRRSTSPRPRATVRSWAFATASWPAAGRRSRACSSIPNRSSPSMATRCSRTSWRPCHESGRRPAQRHRHPADRGDARRMARRRVGDDVFGDDPSVNALQEQIAALLGKEAALFVASGTQSNLVAIMSHCGRGDEYIVGQMAHTYRWEGGGAAVLGSVQPQPLEHEADGRLALERIEAAIKPNDAHFAQEPPALPREHDRRQGAAARLPRGGDRARARPRPRDPSRRRAPLQRRGQARRVPAGGAGGAVRQRLGLLLEGPRRAGRLGAGRLEGLHRRGAPLAQDGRRRHAPGRRRRRRGAATRSTTMSTGSPRTTRSRRASPTGLAGPARPDGRAAADQHRLRRPRRRARARA